MRRAMRFVPDVFYISAATAHMESVPSPSRPHSGRPHSIPSWRSCQKGEKTTRDGRRTGRLCPALCAVAHQVIREDQRHHGLADGHGPDAATGIVTDLGHPVDLFALRADAEIGRGKWWERVGQDV